MRHRCTIERNMGSGVDEGGQPVAPDWQTHLADQPCRAWYEQRREATQDTEKSVVIEDRRMILPLDVDVTERDRVLVVTDRRGSVIFTGPASIESLGRREDHLALMLEEVS